MDNSIYITLSRQMAVFRDMEVTSNNIANVDTPGYKAEKLMFSDYLVRDNKRQDAFALDPSSYRDTSRGSIKTTNNTFDMAINGDAYFQVQSPLGTRYTRAGNFQVDGEGTLVTTDGFQVLGADGGQIAVPQDAVNIVVNGAGQITADGQDIGQIGMMEFANEQAMQRLGNSYYSATETPQQSLSARMVQGALEGSNVSGVSELVRVMELQRSVGNTAKFIEAAYDLERKTGQVYARQQS